uniref:Uncharacterized protein n=1 Tax=Spongospora subterranea TaxID=70186 RepID=A0A0H5R2D2_9EUKA|eukprot:CRZ02039.1 hypothetical protein [Spongospora subterranea]
MVSNRDNAGWCYCSQCVNSLIHPRDVLADCLYVLLTSLDQLSIMLRYPSPSFARRMDFRACRRANHLRAHPMLRKVQTIQSISDHNYPSKEVNLESTEFEYCDAMFAEHCRDRFSLRQFSLESTMPILCLTAFVFMLILAASA